MVPVCQLVASNPTNSKATTTTLLWFLVYYNNIDRCERARPKAYINIYIYTKDTISLKRKSINNNKNNIQTHSWFDIIQAIQYHSHSQKHFALGENRNNTSKAFHQHIRTSTLPRKTNKTDRRSLGALAYTAASSNRLPSASDVVTMRCFM